MSQNYLAELIPQIQINSNIAVIGQKGTGKSSLGQFFQPLFPRKVIIDTKGEYYEQGAGIYHAHHYKDFYNKFVQLLPHDRWTIIMHFNPQDPPRELILNEICKNIYDAEEIYLVIEEIHLLSNAHKVPNYLLEIVTTGRSRNIGYMITSTRPALINNTLLSEIDIYFIGRLLSQGDRDSFRDILGESRKSLAHLQNFNFIYYNVSTSERKLIKT